MKIKQQAEDFQVEELTNIRKSKEGEYTYFWLEKTNWTTTRAIKEISRKSRVSIKRFGWAGTKDKIGVTKQVVCAWNVEPETLENINLKDIKINIIGKGDKRINLGDLEGNSFKLVVRDLKDQNIDTLKEQISFVKKYGFPNYFGEQRFGKGNTHLIGKEVIKGRIQRAVKLIITYRSNETEEAEVARKFAEENWGKWSEIIKKMPKWFNIEKAILNHLIQHQNDFAGAIRNLPKKNTETLCACLSKLFFNLILSKTLSKTGKNQELKVRNMNLCFPLNKFKILEKIPLPGYKSELKEDTFSNILNYLLEKEEMKLEDFRCKRMPELKSEGTEREAFVKPMKISIGKAKDDELNSGKKKMELKFDLPSGSYATVLLRELFLEEPK